jgi:hypothetical protein
LVQVGSATFELLREIGVADGALDHLIDAGVVSGTQEDSA